MTLAPNIVDFSKKEWKGVATVITLQENLWVSQSLLKCATIRKYLRENYNLGNKNQ